MDSSPIQGAPPRHPPRLGGQVLDRIPLSLAFLATIITSYRFPTPSVFEGLVKASVVLLMASLLALSHFQPDAYLRWRTPLVIIAKIIMVRNPIIPRLVALILQFRNPLIMRLASRGSIGPLVVLVFVSRCMVLGLFFLRSPIPLPYMVATQVVVLLMVQDTSFDICRSQIARVPKIEAWTMTVHRVMDHTSRLFFPWLPWPEPEPEGSIHPGADLLKVILCMQLIAAFAPLCVLGSRVARILEAEEELLRRRTTGQEELAIVSEPQQSEFIAVSEIRPYHQKSIFLQAVCVMKQWRRFPLQALWLLTGIAVLVWSGVHWWAEVVCSSAGPLLPAQH